MLSLGKPVLQVDANVIRRVDTSNPQNLMDLWTVFSKCGHSVDQGRRLENLSWRLWNRETFCVETSMEDVAVSTTTTPPKTIRQSSRTSSEDLPQLSVSVDSAIDEEAVDITTESAPMDMIRPRIRRQDSCASSRSRGKERHITSGDLEKMVVSIVKDKDAIPPLPDKVSAFTMIEPISKSVPGVVPTLERSGSTTTESPSKTSDAPSFDSHEPSSPEVSASHGRTMVVRGFAPSPITVSQGFKPAKPSSDVIPDPQASPEHKPVPSKKSQATFALGASSCEESLSDQAHSPEALRQVPVAPKRKMFQVGVGSSEEDNSIKSSLRTSPVNHLTSQKKQTSFMNQPVTATISAPAVFDDDDDETEADYQDESAIDDEEDDEDWEDSMEESGGSSVEDKNLFQRVDSKLNLTSRRSLITLALENNNNNNLNPANAASRSTSAIARGRLQGRVQQASQLVASPNDSDESPLMMRRTSRPGPLRPISEVPRSAAQPILSTPTINHDQPLSPRTTRRNMLSAELPASLRRHLLWERSQKSSTVNAVLKRRHTSHDVANLKQFPDQSCMKDDDDANAASFDRYLNRDAWNSYHSKGW